MKARLKWLKRYKSTNCYLVIFSDETMFSEFRKVRRSEEKQFYKALKIGKDCHKVNAWTAIT